MSLYHDTITNITKKLNNNEQLLFGENTIYNMYMSHLKTIIFCDKPNEHINVYNIHNMIQKILLRDKTYIFKLVFSNDKSLYIPINILTKLEYFKNMIGDYIFKDSCIIEIELCKEIDNYNCILDIITFVDSGNYEKKISIFQDFYDMILIVDYFGEICHKLVNILDEIVNCYKSSVWATRHIHNYNGNTFDAFINMYNILTNSNTNYDKDFIIYLWSHATDLDNNVDKIINSQIFKELIMYSGFGIKYLIKHKKYEYFYEILNMDNYRNIRNGNNKSSKKCHKVSYVIDFLIDDNTLESYTVIYNLAKVKHDNHRNYVFEYVERRIGRFTDLIFNFDISIFHIFRQLQLMIKHDKTELLERIAEHIFGNTSRGYYRDLIVFINKHNEKKLSMDIGIYPSLINFSPIKEYKIHEVVNNNVYYNWRPFYQIISYLPLEYKLWTHIGYIESFDIVDDVAIGFTIHLEYDKTKSLKNKVLLVNKNNNEKYNTMIVNNSSKGITSALRKVEINSDSMTNIKVGDYVYI